MTDLDYGLQIWLNDEIDHDDLPGVEQFLIEKLSDIGISASKVQLYEKYRKK